MPASVQRTSRGQACTGWNQLTAARQVAGYVEDFRRGWLSILKSEQRVVRDALFGDPAGGGGLDLRPGGCRVCRDRGPEVGSLSTRHGTGGSGDSVTDLGRVGHYPELAANAGLPVDTGMRRLVWRRQYQSRSPSGGRDPLFNTNPLDRSSCACPRTACVMSELHRPPLAPTPGCRSPASAANRSLRASRSMPKAAPPPTPRR